MSISTKIQMGLCFLGFAISAWYGEYPEALIWIIAIMAFFQLGVFEATVRAGVTKSDDEQD